MKLIGLLDDEGGGWDFIPMPPRERYAAVSDEFWQRYYVNPSFEYDSAEYEKYLAAAAALGDAEAKLIEAYERRNG